MKKKISYIYNTTIGEAIVNKSQYLREKFKIDNDKKIILAIGTLLEITGIDKFLESTKEWDNQFVLVLHGWIPNESTKQLIFEYLNKFPEKIFYSNEPLKHTEKFKLFSSADIGLIYYSPSNLNLKYAAWSSGKFFDFMRCGVPIIANDINNMKKLVLKNKVGLVVKDYKQINKKFRILLDKQNFYFNNCHNTFKKYNFIDSFKISFNTLI